MSDLTVSQCRALVLKSPFERRRPSPEFVASRLANRARRRAEGRRIVQSDGQIDWKAAWEEHIPVAGGASFFNLVLDTTAPGTASLSLNGGASTTTSATITARANTSDNPATGYQIKIWGSVDTGANASIQASEGASAWITPTWTNGSPSFADQTVVLSSGDGSKTINMKIRDDVWNETSTLTQNITLDSSVPVASITVGPDATKVSVLSGKRTVNFSFQSDVAIDAWKVKVVSTSGSLETTGTQIGTTNGSTGVTGGSLAAATNQAVVLDARDVQAASAGDGTKVIKVFVKETATQLWSTA